jgi:hypothetical protein
MKSVSTRQASRWGRTQGTESPSPTPVFSNCGSFNGNGEWKRALILACLNPSSRFPPQNPPSLASCYSCPLEFSKSVHLTRLRTIYAGRKARKRSCPRFFDSEQRRRTHGAPASLKNTNGVCPCGRHRPPRRRVLPRRRCSLR